MKLPVTNGWIEAWGPNNTPLLSLTLEQGLTYEERHQIETALHKYEEQEGAQIHWVSGIRNEGLRFWPYARSRQEFFATPEASRQEFIKIMTVLNLKSVADEILAKNGYGPFAEILEKLDVAQI